MQLNLKKISILIIEDMEPMRLIQKGVLEHIDVGKIYTAENGEDGLEITKRVNPDIILADWKMHPMDGIEFSKAVRGDVTMPNRYVPIIMVTGFNATHRVAMARDAGVTEFLIKPFTAQQLARRIAYVINKPRDFIETRIFFGPDRRRQNPAHFNGPYRRTDDKK